MCAFVALAVPGGSLERLRPHCPRGLHLEVCGNASIAEALGVDATAFWLTSGGCSCDLAPREAGDADADEPPPRAARLRRKFRRRGWSPAKVERAVKDALRGEISAAPRAGFSDDAAALLVRLVEQYGALRFVVCAFDGSIDVPVAVEGGGQVEREQLTTSPVEYGRVYRLGMRG